MPESELEHMISLYNQSRRDWATLVSALETIYDVPAVPFSTDRLKHAERTIAELRKIARTTLRLVGAWD